jgi:hypothetical protein
MYGKMKKLKKGMLVFLLIVLVVNYVPPVKGLLDFGQKYYYTTLHEGALRRFELYKQENPATTDTVLYRTFKRNPLLIWRWHDYLFHPRYKLPYIDPEQITRK